MSFSIDHLLFIAMINEFLRIAPLTNEGECIWECIWFLPSMKSLIIEHPARSLFSTAHLKNLLGDFSHGFNDLQTVVVSNLIDLLGRFQTL